MMFRDWAMFSDAGNIAVDVIVHNAKERGLSWKETYENLVILSNIKGFGEATDTAVRELVYSVIATEDEDFYV